MKGSNIALIQQQYSSPSGRFSKNHRLINTEINQRIQTSDSFVTQNIELSHPPSTLHLRYVGQLNQAI